MVTQTRSRNISLTTPAHLYEIIERLAEREHRSKSAQVIHILTDWLREHDQLGDAA